MSDFPLWKEIAPPDIMAALRSFVKLPYPILFDSALPHATLGQYSFLAADPFATIVVDDDGVDGLAELARAIEPFACEPAPDIPPFQGGAAGLLSYELCHSLERIPSAEHDEFRIPRLVVGLYDVVLAIDHRANRAWLVSQGFPETDTIARRERAAVRLAEAEAWLAEITSDKTASTKNVVTASAIHPSSMATRYPTLRAGITSDFSREGYEKAVAVAIEYIRAGDVFQVNLSQRLLAPASDDPLTLYQRLRRTNPAPFGGYFDIGSHQICSTSPERFLKIVDREIEARPIKGTRARSRTPEADLYAGDDLLTSEKDRAENIMIVDLMRNDLARCCTAESVRVPQLCGLESYAYVQHLVSVITGKLRPECTPIDALRSAFPGGSITGAPKIRAMEIIAELEPTARGAYCGSLFYLGFNGALDASILIRTVTASRRWLQIPVGGGITAQSDPASEWDETWHKARGMLAALG